VHDDIDRILIDGEAIARRVAQLGQQIAGDLGRLASTGEILLVPVLTGSIIFVADLIRRLPHKVRIAVVTVTSYPGRATVSHGPAIEGELPTDLRDRHVLIVDDILDSGRTIRLLQAEIAARGAKTVRTCVLLRKTIPSALGTPCDYVGFDIPNEFVVGYGLDYDDYYRNLPYVGTLKREAMG